MAVSVVSYAAWLSLISKMAISKQHAINVRRRVVEMDKYGYRIGYEGLSEEKARRLYENEEMLKDFLKGFHKDWQKGFIRGLHDRFGSHNIIAKTKDGFKFLL